MVKLNQTENNQESIKISAQEVGNQVVDFDITKLFQQILRKWPLILLTTALGYFISNLYLRYANAQYSASLSLLVKDTRYSGGMSETTIFQDLGMLNASRNLDNEVLILKTVGLMEDVVKRLNLQYSYTSLGRLKTAEFYNNAPVSVSSWQPLDTAFQRKYEFPFNYEGGNKFTIDFQNKKYTGQFGAALKLPVGYLTLNSNQSKRLNDPDLNLVITLDKPVSVASRLSKQLKVNLDAKSRGTVLELVFTDPIPERAIDILTHLLDVYNQSEVEDKNRIYKNTLDFIDDRIEILGAELKDVEGNVAQFKASTGAINLGSEGGILLGEINNSEREMVSLNAQMEISSFIKNLLLRNEKNFEIIPTSESLLTPSLAGLVSSFNNLVLEREKLFATLGSAHPSIGLLENQLSNLRVNILENINAAERQMAVTKRMMTGRDAILNSRIRQLPNTEKTLLEIERQQAIKQQLFLYLLQKREETALSLNVTVANNRVIEPVRMQGQVSPKPKQVRLIGLSLGLLLPIIALLVIQALNKHVMIEDHIKAATGAPILSTIPFTQQKNHIVIGENSRSAAAEMFRLLRANLQFICEGVDNKVIAITSSVSGEGKSFITLNLGLTLALADKKVLIIEMDMRKPKLASYLGYKKNSGKGLTEYLVQSVVQKKEIIYASELNGNLFYIPCGPIPPNPSELLLSNRLKLLIDEVKSEYDYVFIDTPPIGLVSDALLLGKLLDATFYVVRQNLTEKRQLKIIEELRDQNKMPSVYVVFNGVKFGLGGYGLGGSYGYGYGYNYGYGYGYYADANSKGKSIFDKIKSAFSLK